MINTEFLQLEKYEATDAANLTDGYNNSMDKIDTFAKGIEPFNAALYQVMADGTIQLKPTSPANL